MARVPEKTIFLYSVVLSLVSVHSEKTLELLLSIRSRPTSRFSINLSIFEAAKSSQRRIVASRSCEIAEKEMKERSEVLQRAKCRDIKSYNSSNRKTPMRSLVVIIDEYADLVAVLSRKEKEEFERVISRITARGQM